MDADDGLQRPRAPTIPTLRELHSRRHVCFPRPGRFFQGSDTDDMGKAIAAHSSTPAWKIPWMEEPGGLPESQTQLRDFTFIFHFPALEKEMATHSSVLAWRIPGMEELGGLPSMGSHRIGHD